VTSKISEHYDSAEAPIFLDESSPDSIIDAVASSDLVAFGCPYLSTGISPAFFDLLDHIPSVDRKPCIFVLACGSSGLLVRGSVRSAVKMLQSIGFHPVESVVIDNTYGLSLGELLPKHEKRIEAVFKRLYRHL